jgi:hypothetical protein
MSYIHTFLQAPAYAQFFAGFVLLFFFFVFIIELKFFCERLVAKGGIYKVIGYALIIPFGILFLIADAGFNIVYMPMIYFERANKHGEGWLVTSRLQWHKKEPGWYWQKKVSLFICDYFVDRVDPGHCTTSRWS